MNATFNFDALKVNMVTETRTNILDYKRSSLQCGIVEI